MMETIGNAVVYVCLLVSFLWSVEGTISKSYQQAISANYIRMEKFLLEDAKSDPKRHCDWMILRNNEGMDTEGKRFICRYCIENITLK